MASRNHFLIDSPAQIGYLIDTFCDGALHSLVVRQLWELDVGGSNPSAPTNFPSQTVELFILRMSIHEPENMV